MIYDPVLQDDSQVVTSSLINYDISSASSRTPIESTILPKTNMTVSQYISGQGNVNTLDLWLLSLNASHWFTRADYQNTSSIESPFESIISRESINHFYSSFNYWDWDGEPSSKFDFWIDPTNFSKDYTYLISIPSFGNRNITVLNLENITMNGVGTFEAWKISIDLPGFPNFSYYEKNTGMFLSSYLFFVSDIWYNLTSVEIASTPDGYNGPFLSSVSPSNESKLSLGSLISLELTSPYGIDVIYYSWDYQTNSSSRLFIETTIPVAEGWHNLSIVAYDNVGYYTSFLLKYQTDNTLPGIILNSPRNNSRIRGISQIEFTVVSGSGVMTFNWDNNPSNESTTIISEQAFLSVPSPLSEITHSLSVYVNSSAGVWTSSKYIFSVDNTLPSITLNNFENYTIQKGAFNIKFNVSEDVNVTYSLNDGDKVSLLLEEHQNHSIPYNTLTNGTYNLHIEIRDEAGNINSLNLTFYIYTSDFAWNWDLIADEPRSLDVHDENDTFWFTSSVVSRSNQFFNLSLLTEDSYPNLPANSILGLGFQCELPEDIIFLTLTYPLSEKPSNFTDTFPLYQWVIWDNQEWVEVDTHYDQVSHAWKTTNIGYTQYFALIDSGETTQLKSVVVGGGSIPAFELPTILFSVCVILFIKKVKRKCQ